MIARLPELLPAFLRSGVVYVVLLWSVFSGPAEAVEPKVATGWNFTVYLAPNGTVWTWGGNDYGQLGQGDFTGRSTPTQVSGLADVISVAAGVHHVLALCADGTVWGWGRDSEGQLGQGAAGTTQTTPIQVPVLAGVGFIACGGFHSMALTSPSSWLYAWGRNEYGQVGNSSTTQQNSPQLVMKQFRSVSGGLFHSVGIGMDGAAYAWGRDNNGQLGDDATFNNKSFPVAVAGGYTDVVSISAGFNHSIMCRANTSVHCWGDDSNGQLGNGSSITAAQGTPYSIGYSGWKVVAGANHSLILYPGGYVYAVGDNSEGQCQTNPADTTKYELPTGLGWLYPRPGEVVGGPSNHIMMTASNGGLMGWGDNSDSQLGIGSASNYSFSQVNPLAKWSLDVFISLSAGNAHTLGLKADGTVWAWGSDNYGQLGDDVALVNKSSPVQVAGLAGVMEICAGGYHSLALSTSGSVSAWGWDGFGQLGNDSTLANSPTPVGLLLSPKCGLGAGAYHSLAIDSFGRTLQSWGGNGSGQLGDGTYTDQPTPVIVSGVYNALKVEAGFQHSLALLTTSTVQAWGADWNGQLGDDDSLAGSSFPVTTLISGVFDIAAGQAHSTATTAGVILAENRAYGWGADYFGQLGNGAPADIQPKPSLLTPPFTMKKVAAGADYADFSIYLANDGLVYSCGADGYGQLGDNASIANQETLVLVAGLSQICVITAGDYHAVALAANGTLHAWGRNFQGQLGDGIVGAESPTPITLTSDTWKPQVSVTAVDNTGSEAGANSLTYRFSRSSTNDGAVTVNFSLGGSAVSGADYTPVSGLATIPSGQSFVDVAVTPLEDQDDEDSETVDVTLSSGDHYRIGSPSGASGTISDNDTSGFNVSSISANTQEADQASNLARTFTVSLKTRPSGNVVLDLSSSNTAEGSVDTNPAPGNQGGTQLTFTPTNWDSSTPQTVQVFGQNDDFDDGDIVYSIVIKVNTASTLDPKYDPLDPPDVAITNIDNDTAGILVSTISGGVTEAGGSSTFTITLASRPYNPVNFTLSSSDTSEGVLGAGSSAVTINPADWATGANITVQGVDDAVDDGDQAFRIDINKSNSSDPAYNNLGGWDVEVTCIDDDTKGVVLSSTSINATEGGAKGSYTVRLNSAPTSQVTLTINSPVSSQVTVDTDEGTSGNQNTLIFTTANWNTTQTVRVTAVDDADVESSPHFGTIQSSVNAGSGDYSSGVTISDVTVNITDNDSAGFIVLPATTTSSRQITTESGGTASFTVRLKTQPGVGQTVNLLMNTNDLSEGRLAGQPAILATSGADGTNDQFTFADTVDLAGLGLAIGQSVTVLDSTTHGGQTTTITALQTFSPKYVQVAADLSTTTAAERVVFLPTGSFPYVVTTDAAVASPSNRFNLPNSVDVSLIPLGTTVLVTTSLTNNAGVRGLVTSKSNVTNGKHIVINPTGADTMVIEGAEILLLAPPNTLAFTNGTWSTDQSVTVTGQDDLITDPTSPNNLSNYSIDLVVDTSSATRDTSYDAVVQPNQFLRNQDDDVAGIRIVQDGGATAVDEANTTATDTYRVRLNTQPATGTVVVIEITPDSQVTTNKSLLVFTASNYSTEQVVTVTAVNDDIDEVSSHVGAITHSIGTDTDDVTYGALTGLDDISVTVADNDTAGIVVSPTVGLVTTEAGFSSSFTVVLSSRPTANVTLGVSSNNTAEGTVSPTSLVFTPANWYLAQSVTVTGVNDAIDDGDTTWNAVTAAATSIDGAYAGFDPANVLIVNVDNDAAGVTVTQSSGTTAVTEGGTTDSFTVVLTAQPASGSVTVTLSPGSQVSLSTSTLTFTTGTWNSAQTVTVTAANDDVAEGTHSTNIGLSASGVGYTGLSVTGVTVSITDNDTAGTTVSAAAVATTESGDTGTFTFRLNTQPTANVTVLLTSSDTTEGTVSPSSLTFTPGDFSTNQTITLTGVDDNLDDGDIPYSTSFTLVSADPAYNNLAVSAKSVSNSDNDTAGFTITAISNALNEDGTSGRFTVRLTSEPTDSVFVDLVAGDATEASVSVSSLSFDNSNWNEPQELTVTGVDDAINDGDVASSIILTVAGSTLDAGYLPLNPADVSVSTQDDDQAGVATSAPAVTTTELGAAVTFTVQLLSQPSADVTVPLTSGDTTEGTVSPASLTFSVSNWNVPQIVTVTPVDDFAVDGTVSYTLELGTITGSSDTTGYAGLDPQDVNLNNNDNDAAAFTLSATTATTTEGATAFVANVVLTSQPTSDVLITVTGLDATEGSLSATTLTFTPSGAGAWNIPQSLTITGIDDALDDGDQNYTLVLTPSSGDTVYDALAPQNINVTNSDNDAAAVVISQSGGDTTVAETGATDTYTIQLSSQPLVVATVTVTPDSQVRVNGSATPVLLTFDPALSSGEPTAWNTMRTITVSAVVDTFDEANPHAANITHTVGNYVDQASAAVNASPVAVTVNDNDPPQTTVTSLTVGRALNDTITTTMISATDDDTAAASLVFTVILAPGQGELWLDYGQVGQDLLINGDTFNQAAITANRLSYHNSGTPNTSDGFAFRVSDAVGNQSDLSIFNITVTGFIPPSITLNNAYSPAYTENDPALAVDTAPTVSDPDSTYFSLLTITLSGAGVGTDDELFFATTGSVSASSGTISHASTPIGTYTGGTGTTALTVTFNASIAGDAQLTDLLNALRYRNTSEDPLSGTRTVEIVLRDESGTENVAVTKSIPVLAQNDAPTISATTLITPKNVTITSTLTVGDVDNYPLDLEVVTPPGKGTLSGVLAVGSITTLTDANTSRSFTYTPTTGQEGADSFVVRVTDPDGAQTSATITVLIIGGTASRPWIVSDAPVEAEAGSTLSYNIVVDFAELGSAPTSGQVTYSLVGTLPSGVSLSGFTPSGTNATLALTIGSGATGVIEAGIVVTETANNTSGYQPLTIVIVPPGSLGN